jgi:hypothetical protein
LVFQLLQGCGNSSFCQFGLEVCLGKKCCLLLFVEGAGVDDLRDGEGLQGCHCLCF